MITPVQARGTHLRDAPARRRGCGCALPLAVLILLLVAIGGYGYSVYQSAMPRLLAGRASLESALEILRETKPANLTPALLDDARSDLATAAADFRAVQDQVGPLLFLAPYLGWVPQIGGDLTQAPGLLKLAIDSADLGIALIDGVRPVAEQLQRPATGSGGGLGATLAPLIQALEADPQAVARADAALQTLKADRAALDTHQISDSRLREALADIDSQLPVLERALNSLAGLPHAVNTLLGQTKPITFLVLLQNQDELRATGGFISAVGLMTIDRGKFTRVEFRDSYAVDNPDRPKVDPPAELLRYMGSPTWQIRDANWAPDFPRTAQAAENFYRLDQGVQVDGTIAVDQQMLRLLLEGLGPATLPGYPDSIQADNVVGLMRHYFMPSPVEITDEWWEHRKDFMHDLFIALAGTMQTLPRDKMLALAASLQQGLDQKHLLIYSHDPATGRWLATAGWDGALAPAAGDTLAVVDSNLGFNKVNDNVTSRVGYTLTLSPAPAQPHQATLAITYNNQSKPDNKPCIQESRYKESYAALTEGCYWNYVRVYVPGGSTLNRATWGSDTFEVQTSREYSMTVFSAFLSVAPAEQRTLFLDYTVPYTAIVTATPNSYDLAVRKQPGTADTVFALNVHLPDGGVLRAARPDVAAAGSWVRYDSVVIETDQRFHLEW